MKMRLNQIMCHLNNTDLMSRSPVCSITRHHAKQMLHFIYGIAIMTDDGHLHGNFMSSSFAITF